MLLIDFPLHTALQWMGQVQKTALPVQSGTMLKMGLSLPVRGCGRSVTGKEENSCHSVYPHCSCQARHNLCKAI